ncbi:hypothetical protein Q3G72_015766 [Acer saccharum]|nr:hypothetical protein Q3G72_015766 [Acer saccharum]
MVTYEKWGYFQMNIEQWEIEIEMVWAGGLNTNRAQIWAGGPIVSVGLSGWMAEKGTLLVESARGKRSRVKEKRGKEEKKKNKGEYSRPAREREITGRKPPGESIPSFLDANHRLRGFAQEERFLR